MVANIYDYLNSERNKTGEEQERKMVKSVVNCINIQGSCVVQHKSLSLQKSLYAMHHTLGLEMHFFVVATSFTLHNTHKSITFRFSTSQRYLIFPDLDAKFFSS